MLVDLNENRDEIAKIYSSVKNQSSEKIGYNYKNLSDEVYYKIKEKIIFRDLKPGERIIDKEIAEEFGVSRSIVRQSLNILEKKGLVTSFPRSGYYVKEIKEKDIEDIYDLRYLIEKYATKQAVSRLSQDEINKLEKLFNDAWNNLKKGSSVKLIEADALLHWVLIDNCGNEKLKDVINNINSLALFYRVIDIVQEDRAEEVYKIHYKIFEAVKNKNAEKAEKLMADHIKKAKNTILNNYEKYTFGGF